MTYWQDSEYEITSGSDKYEPTPHYFISYAHRFVNRCNESVLMVPLPAESGDWWQEAKAEALTA